MFLFRPDILVFFWDMFASPETLVRFLLDSLRPFGIPSRLLGDSLEYWDSLETLEAAGLASFLSPS